MKIPIIIVLQSNTVVLLQTNCVKYSYSLLQGIVGRALSVFKVSGKLHKLRMKIKCSQVRKCLYIALSLSEIACLCVRMKIVLSVLPIYID